MRVQRLAAIAATVIMSAGGLIVGATSAHGATTVVVDCATSSVQNFTVSPGEQIIFSLNNACQTDLSSYGANNTLTLQALVNKMYINNTGGSAIANVIPAGAWTVTYTAGSNPGTDSLDVSAVGVTRALGSRVLTTSNNYTMSIPGGGPPPWVQAYARGVSETCRATWNPSWVQWPNNNTGGFVCVRTLTYNNSSGDWDARRFRR